MPIGFCSPNNSIDMKRPWSKISIRPSTFAGKLTQLVILTLLITMSTIAVVIYVFSKRALTTEAENRYQGFMELTNVKVNNVLTGVELLSANYLLEVEKNLDDPDKIYEILQESLNTNPNIVGCGVGFVPGYYPAKGRWFEPYALKQSDGRVETSQIGSQSHDYFSHEWYVEGIKSKHGYWTNPYYDDAGGKMPMFSYSLPVHDKRGRVVGVLGADISLAWLQTQLKEIDMKNNDNRQRVDPMTLDDGASYSFIIGHDGTYIAHPDKKRILYENLSSYVNATTDTLDNFLCKEMKQGSEGHVLMDLEGVPSYVFYAPLDDTDWSMAIVVPQHTLFRRANVIGATILALMALGLLLAFVVCHRGIRRLTSPLSRFAQSAGEIARGNFDAALPRITTRDEIGLLRDSFEEMQSSLSRYVEDLKRTTASKASLDSELKIAASIQMSMLPPVDNPFPERSDMDIYGHLSPAKGVGGDLFDFYIRDEKLLLCIGDVSGKGVPAALVMAVTRFLFRNISSHEDSPDRIVTEINEAMIDGNDNNMFVTLFVGVLDFATGRLKYCNAGHERPMLIGAGIGWLPCDTNIPAGLRAGWKYSLQEASIQQQTTLLLYTDGLTEAEDAAGHQFGEHRIMQVVQRQLDARQHSPRQLIGALNDAVLAFVGTAEQHDDLALLAVQYKRLPDVRYRRVITLDNDVEQVSDLAAFVDKVCSRVDFDTATSVQLNLAIEEAVVNVMKYAYPVGIRGEIRVEVLVNDKQLQFVISDEGSPFDPTVTADVDTSLGTSERRIGGLGIHLVRKMMDSVEYQRMGNRNVLTLTKRLHTADNHKNR